MNKKVLALVSVFTMLSSQKVLANDWLNTANGHMGRDPIVAGSIGSNRMVVCRSNTSNGLLSGHLVEGQNVCFVAWGNSHFNTGNYSVLQESSNYRWVDRNSVNDNSSLVYVGRNNVNQVSNYICKKNGVPGRLEGGITGICYTSWGNRNYAHSKFDVLIRR